MDYTSYQSAMDDFLASKRAGGLSAHTLRYYTYNLAGYRDWLAEDEARAVAWTDRRTIEGWFAAGRVAGLKATTIEGRYRALSSFFGFLKEQDEYAIKDSPMAKVKRPKVREDQVTRRRAREDEVHALLTSIDLADWVDARDQALIRLLFATGLRLSEVTQLQVGDIDLRDRRMVVKGKNGTVRRQAFPDEIRTALLSYLMSRPVYDGDALWLSVSFRDGVRCELTDNGIRQMLRRRCKAAGVRYLNPHSFRHGMAMHLLKKSGDLKFVSRMLRHSSVAITAKIYTDYDDEALARMYDEVWRK